MGVTRIDQLTDAQRARFDEWADKWIEIGLRTGPSDRQAFEKAAEACYGFAGIPWPGKVVWVQSPLVLSFAGPLAALALQLTHTILDQQEGKIEAIVETLTKRGVVSAQEEVEGVIRKAVVRALGRSISGTLNRAAL